MLRKESGLWFYGNGDARVMLCINPNHKGLAFKKTGLGAFVRGSVRLRRYRRGGLKKRVNRAFALNTKRKLVRPGGGGTWFRHSRVVLVDDKKSGIIGTRVRGPVFRELARGFLEDLVPKVSWLV